MTGDAARAPAAFDRILGWELDVLGSHGMSAARYPAMLAMVTDGRLPIDRLVASTSTLDDGIEALIAPDSGGPGIVVIDRF